jgi:hypothetical protein
MSTKNPKAAQRTQRRDFDKAICLDFILDVKLRQRLNFVSFVLPLVLCAKKIVALSFLKDSG